MHITSLLSVPAVSPKIMGHHHAQRNILHTHHLHSWHVGIVQHRGGCMAKEARRG